MDAQTGRDRKPGRRFRAACVAVLLAGGVLASSAAPALAVAPAAGSVSARHAPGPNNPAYWEYDGLYSCSKKWFPGGKSYTKPDGVAFVVIKAGRTQFVSDLGDSNDGDRTYAFPHRIRYVISCLFTDA
ncbi:hypothetical protein [Pengzhenrongella sicca]|uniref:Uncharacterized protein n=1 Tax=Pengzhenrongella sicca TaxID=2819238 RepID=A0A8A4Z893_9MICO|nr:hypothetical protein [Pengzhenrongella sicca]QTE28130.1 hypothetical protein J4E96_12090 [Pengzhenrongella sicca]